MKRSKSCLALIFLFLSIAIGAIAQKKTVKKSTPTKATVEKQAEKKQPDLAQDEKKVRDIIAFLEYMLNTLGDRATPTRDKEVLITESYSKIFRDSKVQIEDDLDEERRVITNKDVVAYLKDVNFFFEQVRFEFNIENIATSTLPNGHYFYKVSVNRNLKGTTAEHKPVNNTQTRYLEINYNPNDQDLKIVSIYTNEFDEKRALTSWWNELSLEWKSAFRKKLNLPDSVNLDNIKRITTIQDLDLNGNQYILSIDPISQLLGLKSLNLSGTQVTDLAPVRNLTELKELNLSDTEIKDLSPLKYSSNLERLNINKTAVTDVSILAKLPGLKWLEMKETAVANFSSLASLTELEKIDLSNTKLVSLDMLASLTLLIDLNLSATKIQDLTPLKGLKNLQSLDLDSTTIYNFSSLSQLESLRLLHANSTPLGELTPLQNLTHLEKVYCDQTLIKRDAAEAFMTAHPKVLVIFDSKDLKTWWDSLSDGWQKLFSQRQALAPCHPKRNWQKFRCWIRLI
jgi:Leucine-rich repeat (LRR) protein